jgi:uncharacterized membrane protein YkvA (DUF1232 family)
VQAMMEKIRKIIQFIKDVANDERIPERDKKVLLALVALVVSPFDLIPDWIPFFGILDDLFIICIVLDYFFTVLDRDILLSHYPFGFKSFTALRRTAGFVTWLTPSWIREKIWKYKPPAF